MSADPAVKRTLLAYLGTRISQMNEALALAKWFRINATTKRNLPSAVLEIPDMTSTVQQILEQSATSTESAGGTSSPMPTSPTPPAPPPPSEPIKFESVRVDPIKIDPIQIVSSPLQGSSHGVAQVPVSSPSLHPAPAASSTWLGRYGIPLALAAAPLITAAGILGTAWLMQPKSGSTTVPYESPLQWLEDRGQHLPGGTSP